MYFSVEARYGVVLIYLYLGHFVVRLLGFAPELHVLGLAPKMRDVCGMTDL